MVSVISDLVTDQRVHRVCTYLHQTNYSVILIGRYFKYSMPLNERIYDATRILCYFNKGILQYAEFNLKLFFKLLTFKADVFLSNDLDTLTPNFIIAKLRGKKLVYDSHEYFTGTPELQHKRFKKSLWQLLEKLLLPRVKYAYTVNHSIAQLYKKECGIRMLVVRNLPFYNNHAGSSPSLFPPDKTILLIQGAGINEGRGAKELVESMQYLPQTYLLVLIGGGDSWNLLQKLATELNLNEKVLFIPKVPFSQLQQYTQQAHLGISLDKPFCINYKLSLPNKIFDYIHAGIPILASALVEVKNIITTYKVGMVIEEITPKNIAEAVLNIFNHPERYHQWKENTLKAAPELCWQNEQKILDQIFKY